MGHFYSTDATVRSAAYFGRGQNSTDILLDNVDCSGQEFSLLECPHVVGPDDCSHNEDVGVICATSKVFMLANCNPCYLWFSMFKAYIVCHSQRKSH